MGYILSYENGTVGYGLPSTLDEAIADAIGRCEAVACGAAVLDRKTCALVATIEYDPQDHAFFSTKVKA